MKIFIDKDQREIFEKERERKLMKLVGYCMNEGLRHFPMNHAKGIHKLATEYCEICALLENTSVEFEPVELTGYLNEP